MHSTCQPNAHCELIYQGDRDVRPGWHAAQFGYLAAIVNTERPTLTLMSPHSGEITLPIHGLANEDWIEAIAIACIRTLHHNGKHGSATALQQLRAIQQAVGFAADEIDEEYLRWQEEQANKAALAEQSPF